VMVDQLNAFAGEVTRVAREVGTEGKLGGQAQVAGVAGTWKDLTDSVNFMAGNLTSQVRGIAQVVTAVANGDLKRKLTIESKGEIAELANTINAMTDTLATFSDQVTTMAREVGVEGKLGGQANVPGAAGTWRDLTDNVNQLAENLTTQVRAIAEVSTAVTQGDLTRSITVEAQGEVAALKDNINEMIRNLKETTQKNQEQDWLKTNLARFSSMLQGQRDMTTVANMILSELAPLVDAQQGVFYVNQTNEEGEKLMKLLGGYAFTQRKNLSNVTPIGGNKGILRKCACSGGVYRSMIRTIIRAKSNASVHYVLVGDGVSKGCGASCREPGAIHVAGREDIHRIEIAAKHLVAVVAGIDENKADGAGLHGRSGTAGGYRHVTRRAVLHDVPFFLGRKVDRAASASAHKNALAGLIRGSVRGGERDRARHSK